MKLVFGFAVLFLLTSCVSFRPTPVPMPFVEVLFQQGQMQEVAVIFLPGRGDFPSDFVDQGFIEALKQKVPADAYLPDAHFGYYMNGSVLDRLEADLLPLLAERGYKRIWLVGISLGGGGSMMALRTWPEAFERVVLLAPFLGDPPVFEEIQSQGGPSKWVYQPDPRRSGREEQFRGAWGHLQAGFQGRLDVFPHIALAFGENDRFRFAHEVLAELMPPEQVFRTPGGHDWKTWLRLWKNYLEAQTF